MKWVLRSTLHLNHKHNKWKVLKSFLSFFQIKVSNMKVKYFLMSLLVCIGLGFNSCNDEPELSDFESSSAEQNLEFEGFARTCGHAEHMENLLSDPAYLDFHESKILKVEEELLKIQTRATCSNPTVIPVAVHFQGVTGTNANCLKQLVESQIQVLNNDLGGENNDISKWRNQAASFFPNVNNGEACLVFCMATKNHPSGFGLSNGQLAITVNKTNGSQVNAWNGYLNIFVRPNLGFLGEAPLGGSGNGDGILIDAGTFGLGSGCGNVRPQAPYNLGRTATHEVGHYLFLDHIWGNGCNVDDGVSDTPSQQRDNGGCPVLGKKSCNTNDLHMNYMDYTNDACMFMFSAGQVNVMEAYVNSSLSNLVNKAAQVCGDVPPGGGVDEEEEEEPSSSCARPTNTTTSSISPTSQKVDWTSMQDAISYRIRYRQSGTTSWTVKTISGSQITLTGLKSNTTYQYQVRTRCPGRWTYWTVAKTFKTVQENDGGGQSGDCDQGKEINLIIRLDDYGSETSWELVNEAGQSLDTGGPYQDGQRGSLKRKSFCLSDGCYTMYIDDAYGDGICCDYGYGKVWIRNANNRNIITSNGRFGTYTALDFCVDGSLPREGTERHDEPKEGLARKAANF